jgi:hypothetical protein
MVVYEHTHFTVITNKLKEINFVVLTYSRPDYFCLINSINKTDMMVLDVTYCRMSQREYFGVENNIPVISCEPTSCPLFSEIIVLCLSAIQRKAKQTRYGKPD